MTDPFVSETLAEKVLSPVTEFVVHRTLLRAGWQVEPLSANARYRDHSLVDGDGVEYWVQTKCAWTYEYTRPRPDEEEVLGYSGVKWWPSAVPSVPLAAVALVPARAVESYEVKPTASGFEVVVPDDLPFYLVPAATLQGLMAQCGTVVQKVAIRDVEEYEVDQSVDAERIYRLLTAAHWVWPRQGD